MLFILLDNLWVKRVKVLILSMLLAGTVRKLHSISHTSKITSNIFKVSVYLCFIASSFAVSERAIKIKMV
jgi:hypothetical protein